MPGLFRGTPLERPVTCEHCGQALDERACPRDGAGNLLLPKDQPARVRREKRRGKHVTVIAGLDPSATDMKGLLKELRKAFGVGGSIAGDEGAPEIELQGDHREKVVELLKERGYPAKAAGG